MLISTLAALAGCSERAIRHYHQIRLLAEPKRLSNGYRDYQISDLNRVLTIRALLDAGIPLADIGTDIDFAAALSRIDARISQLQQQRSNLVRLAQHPLGAPERILTAVKHHLRNSNYPEALIDHEIDSLQLMGICGVATDATWKQLHNNLHDPKVAEQTRSQAKLWHKIGSLSPESEEFSELIRQIALLLPTGIMANLPSTLRAKDLPLTLNEFTLPYPYNLALEQLAGMMQS